MCKVELSAALQCDAERDATARRQSKPRAMVGCLVAQPALNFKHRTRSTLPVDRAVTLNPLTDRLETRQATSKQLDGSPINGRQRTIPVAQRRLVRKLSVDRSCN